jgi:hypothetical protein
MDWEFKTRFKFLRPKFTVPEDLEKLVDQGWEIESITESRIYLKRKVYKRI